MRRKKILMIANYFPPSAVVGVQRTLKFVKYLPHFNWDPIVLTVKNSYTPATDEELLKDIPENVTVHKANCWGIRCSKYTSDEYCSISQSLWTVIRKNFLKTLYLPFPDPRIGWLLPATVSAKRIIREKQVDLIYTSSPSHSIHFIAYLLRKLTKTPWIADFRDPWATVSALQDDLLRHRIQTRQSEIYERMIVKAVDLLLTTTELTRQDFLKRYPDVLSPSKIRVITNGYDEEDFHAIDTSASRKDLRTTQTGKRGPFTFTYTGTFQLSQAKRTPEYFLRALKKVVTEEPEIGEDIKVCFAGVFNQRDRKLFGDPALRNTITVKEHLSHKESILCQLRSDVLLLIQVSPSRENWTDQTLPLKIFEYVRAQKPILALTHKGSTRDFVRNYNLGMTVKPDDVEGIKSAILEMYSRHKADTLKVSHRKEFVEKFDRRNLTAELAEILDEIVADPVRTENSGSLNRA